MSSASLKREGPARCAPSRSRASAARSIGAWVAVETRCSLSRLDQRRPRPAHQIGATVDETPRLCAEIVKRSDDVESFLAPSRRWVVELVGLKRRLVNDDERRAASLTALATLDSIRIAITRPARSLSLE